MVAGTGTDLPGLDTVLALPPPDFVGGPPFSGAALNNRGMILFDATVIGASAIQPVPCARVDVGAYIRTFGRQNPGCA